MGNFHYTCTLICKCFAIKNKESSKTKSNSLYIGLSIYLVDLLELNLLNCEFRPKLLELILAKITHSTEFFMFVLHNFSNSKFPYTLVPTYLYRFLDLNLGKFIMRTQ